MASATYPDVYEKFLTCVEVVSLDVGWMLSAGCLIHTNFYINLLVVTMAPLAILALVWISYILTKTRIERRLRQDNNGHGTVEAEQWDTFTKRHVSFAFWISFLVYSPSSSALFQTFACDDLDTGLSYLKADYSIECKTITHAGFRVYSAVMCLVYPIGIPVCYARLLWKHKESLTNANRDSNAAVQYFKDLWRPYRPEGFLYYEVLECVRRVLLAGIVVFIFPDTAGQTATIFLLALVFFCLLMQLNPYEDEREGWLARLGHAVVMMSMFIALLQKVGLFTCTFNAAPHV